MDLFWLGLGLGLAAGFSPGPLLTLVITSSLERGFGAGARVALAPLITDAPIILLALLVLRTLPDGWLALVGALGGCLVVSYGLQNLRLRSQTTHQDQRQSGDALDIARGALVNLLNPHPWIFWVTVQGPILLAGWRRDPRTAVAFVTAFYAAIVGSKVGIAALVSKGRHNLNERWYRRTLIACGLVLVVIGVSMLFQAASRLW
jgi:threonine/homoserine/homoserine lactone efflux protein